MIIAQRVVSLLPSATEIVCALGLEHALVGRSHECDFPPSVARLPVLTAPKIPLEGSSAEIDRAVRRLVAEALSVYRVDGERLAALAPDVIVTQSQCEVCAVSERDVAAAVRDAAGARLISLAPSRLDDVWGDIARVGEALGVDAAPIVAKLRSRLDALARRTAGLARPTVGCIEWLDPPMAAGNWVPELVELAGGAPAFGTAGAHSSWLSWDELLARDPDVLVLLPCGFDRARTRAELPSLAAHPGWARLGAVRAGRVAVTDGSAYFNRPGPRLVESAEILAEIVHGLDFGHRGRAWEPI